MTERPSGLDDPEQAAFAWARYRRILAWMALGGAAASAAIIWLLDRVSGPLTLVAKAAGFAGIFASILMAAALMGLVFLSSGSGHDETVDRREE